MACYAVQNQEAADGWPQDQVGLALFRGGRGRIEFPAEYFLDTRRVCAKN